MKKRIIGAGLPRTGTTSLTAALEILGFGPVLHSHGGQQRQYTKLLHAKAASPDADASELQKKAGISLSDLVAPYNATLDSPSIDFYTELFDLYPDSLVILSVRDSDEQWWQSWYGTFGEYFDLTMRGFLLQTLIWPTRRISDTKAMVSAYVDVWRSQYGSYSSKIHQLHNSRVIERIPSDRLLVFNVKEGWEPLCTFLGVPVPKEPFPQLNESRAKKDMMRALCRESVRRWAGILSMVGFGIWQSIRWARY